jgi:hypothetical protein
MERNGCYAVGFCLVFIVLVAFGVTGWGNSGRLDFIHLSYRGTADIIAHAQKKVSGMGWSSWIACLCEWSLSFGFHLSVVQRS